MNAPNALQSVKNIDNYKTILCFNLNCVYYLLDQNYYVFEQKFGKLKTLIQ